VTNWYATGVNFLLTGIEAKRLGLLHDLVPTAALIGVLFNPNNSNFETQLRDVQEAAHSIGQQIHVLHASSEPDIHAAFKTFVQMRVQALLVGGDRRQSVVLTFRPAILDRYVLTFGEPALPEALMECCQRIGGLAWRAAAEEANHGHRHTPLPCEVRKGNNSTPLACCP
jgi:putative ABC transport system substrate-binding protein